MGKGEREGEGGDGFALGRKGGREAGRFGKEGGRPGDSQAHTTSLKLSPSLVASEEGTAATRPVSVCSAGLTVSFWRPRGNVCLPVSKRVPADPYHAQTIPIAPSACALPPCLRVCVLKAACVWLWVPADRNTRQPFILVDWPACGVLMRACLRECWGVW